MGASIHTSRGFGGYRPASCHHSSLRFLGPSPGIAVPLTALWLATCGLHAAIIVQAATVLRHSDYSRSHTSFLLAVVETLLSTTTLVAVVWVVRIDCCYDPD
ncbi:hypothetical protein J6590_068813 [Homalodisca vitripennis]|nr:hypothetical protein J6590_068813 [Homalodisca vitripennis]